MTMKRQAGFLVSQMSIALTMLVTALLSVLEGGLDHQVVIWCLGGVVLTLLVRTVFSTNWALNGTVKPVWAPYYLLCAYALISLFWSLDPYRTAVELFQLLTYGGILFIAVTLSKDELFKVLRMAMITAALITIFGLSIFLFISSSRMSATFPNPNPLGTYLGMFAVFTLVWSLHMPKKSLWTLAVVFASGLLLTGSRGAMLSVAAALPLVFLPAAKTTMKRNLGKVAMWAVAAFLLTQMIIFAAPYTQDMAGRNVDFMGQLIRPQSYASSTEGRFAFWQAGINAGLSQPVTGYGLGTYFLAYYLETPTDRWFSRFAHNHYAQTFAELGLPGLLLLLGFLFSALRAGYRASMSSESPPYAKGLLAAMVVFVLHIGLDFSWNFPAVPAVPAFFFFLTGMALVMAPLEQPAKTIRVPRWMAIPLVVLLAWVGVHLYVGHLYNTAASLDAHGQVVEATVLLERANGIYPINAGSHRMLSMQYQQLFEATQDPRYLEKALQNGQRAVDLSPVDATGHHNLGQLHARLGHVIDAEYHYGKAVEYAGHRTRMFLDLGWFYITQERLKEAVAVLEQGISYEDIILTSTYGRENLEQVQNDLVYMYALLTRVHSDWGEPEQAHAYMVAARDVDPDHDVVQRYFQ